MWLYPLLTRGTWCEASMLHWLVSRFMEEGLAWVDVHFIVT